VIFCALGQRYQASDFATRTFDSFRPWINVECGGKWYVPEKGDPSPIYLIKQEAHELDRRWKRGERLLFYKPNKGGKASRFYPSHLKAHLRPKHIDEMIAGQCKYYFTGGRHGQTLVMLDVDAHEPWQTDAKETMLQIVEFFGPENCFVVESTRGYNVFVKWQYLEPKAFTIFRKEMWKAVNKTLSALQTALKRATADRLSCVEVKGTISTSSQNYGSLAKLPCYGAWSEDRLREFNELPVVDTAWLQDMIGKLDQINPGPVKTSMVKAGSCDSFTLSQEEIDSIPGLVKSLRSRSWYCHGRRVDPKRQDVKLVPIDFAYAFVVLSLARRHRKEKFGEQMPSNFIQVIWTHLYQSGIFSRGFDTSRWKAIRNTLADCGFLLFIDNRYWFDKDGEKRGKSMEWRLLDEYDVFLAQEERGEEAIIQEAYPIHEPNRWRPVLVNPKNSHYRLIERSESWENEEYGGFCCAMAA
jgi:hypothetical protein